MSQSRELQNTGHKAIGQKRKNQRGRRDLQFPPKGRMGEPESISGTKHNQRKNKIDLAIKGHKRRRCYGKKEDCPPPKRNKNNAGRGIERPLVIAKKKIVKNSDASS